MKTIFVSSTFKDMQFERDAIHNKITPHLNEKARLYGENVSFCDLRWGVNTENLDEKESSLKVLSVCLNEIERCRPYFVVILGDRYGFIPDSETISDATKRKNFKLDNEDCSITALEIEFGALSNADQMKRTFFYFREIVGEDVPAIYKSEGSLHTAKLEKLKEKITARGGRIKNYTLIWNNEQKIFTGLENFVDMLVTDVSDLMDIEFQEYARLSEYEKDQHIQWEFAKQKSAQFAGRQNLIQNYMELLNDGVNFLAIKGESGSGKSTLMSQLAFKLRDEGYEVLPLFSSLTPKTSDAANIALYIVEELKRKIPHVLFEEDMANYVQNSIAFWDKIHTFFEKHKLLQKFFHIPMIAVYKFFKWGYRTAKKINLIDTEIEEAVDVIHNETKLTNKLRNFYFRRNGKRFYDYLLDLREGVELWNSFDKKIGNPSVKKKFIILLDASDQLVDNIERTQFISCLIKFQGNVQVVISCLPNFSLPEDQSIKVEMVTHPAPITKLEIINGILKYIGRELGEPVITEILKKINSENPLYLSLLINRLTMMDKKDFDEINSSGGQISDINAQQIKILKNCSDDLDDLCVEIIDTASEKIGGNFVNLAMSYIAISRYGLRESDLEHILTTKDVQWNSVDFALFVQYLSSFFVRRVDGRIDFTHKNIRAGCLKLIDDTKSVHSDIVAHLKTLGADDELLQNEIVWHCFNADDKEFLLNYVGMTFKMGEYSSLVSECENIFKAYSVDWWQDLLELSKLKKFFPVHKILSLFFGQIFFRVNLHTEEKTLLRYCNYIRLNCREYPDLLLAVYCLLGMYYKEKSKNLARKFANKGIALVGKIYTQQEIDSFTPNITNGFVVVECSPRSEIFRIARKISIESNDDWKENLKLLGYHLEQNPKNPNVMIMKRKK